MNIIRNMTAIVWLLHLRRIGCYDPQWCIAFSTDLLPQCSEFWNWLWVQVNTYELLYQSAWSITFVLKSTGKTISDAYCMADVREFWFETSGNISLFKGLLLHQSSNGYKMCLATAKIYVYFNLQCKEFLFGYFLTSQGMPDLVWSQLLAPWSIHKALLY